jgi:CheY-like chemotaxis protein
MRFARDQCACVVLCRRRADAFRQRPKNCTRNFVPFTRANTVLLVDDDPDFRTLMRELLEDEGCSVREAENGRHALEVLETFLPDLILMDLMMPEMNGWELFDALQKRVDLASIPVAVVSAVSRTGPPGALQVISKPIDLPNLLGLLDAIDAPSVASVRNASNRVD